MWPNFALNFNCSGKNVCHILKVIRSITACLTCHDFSGTCWCHFRLACHLLFQQMYVVSINKHFNSMFWFCCVWIYWTTCIASRNYLWTVLDDTENILLHTIDSFGTSIYLSIDFRYYIIGNWSVPLSDSLYKIIQAGSE